MKMTQFGKLALAILVCEIVVLVSFASMDLVRVVGETATILRGVGVIIASTAAAVVVIMQALKTKGTMDERDKFYESRAMRAGYYTLLTCGVAGPLLGMLVLPTETITLYALMKLSVCSCAFSLIVFSVAVLVQYRYGLVETS